MEASSASRTYLTAAPGGWGLSWESGALASDGEWDLRSGDKGSPRLGTHLRTLMPEGFVSGKGQALCWEVTLGTLVPEGARPDQGGVSTWLPRSPEVPGISGLRDRTGRGLCWDCSFSLG